jgi:autotransporter-associated beta strand protein
MVCSRKADKVRANRRVGAVLVAAAALVGVKHLWAGIAFDPTTSTLRITHDANIDDPNDTPFIKNPSTIPPSSGLFPVNNYQMNHTFTFTPIEGPTSTSLAQGSLGHVTNATTASFVLATGTGVTQDDPNDFNIKGSSSLKFNVDMRWDVTTGGFGPIANGYSSLAIGGTVGDLGSATVKVHLLFRNQSGTELRTAWDVEKTYGPGTFTDILTSSRALNAPTATLPAGSKLRVSGTVEFLASNAAGPTNINPIRAEFGGAPPTAHFKIDQDGSYFDQANWEAVDPQEDGLRTIANAAGERAVFFGTPSKVGHIVSLGSTVTLGTMDIGGFAPYSFVNGDSGRIQFISRAGDGNTVLNVRGGGLTHAIQVPVELPENLELSTDTEASIGFGDVINGTGTIQKKGGGRAIFAASNNNFAGDVNVLDGTVRGTALRSLGLGHVTVDGGQVDYAAGGASANPVLVKRGLINVDAVTEGDHFEVQQGGGIGGNPSTVNSLHVGQELLLRSGAMIVHSDATNVQNGNPQGLGNDPLYVFGVAGGLPVGEMAIGTASGTPWVGIGGSRGFNEFGSSEGLITVQGAAVLANLPGGSVDVKSQIGGVGGSLTKLGDGSVRLLNRNPFDGPTSVNEGALIVNGSLGGDVTVKSGGTLAGKGILIGLLQASEAGSSVAPGDGDIGTLSVGKLALGDGSVLKFDIDTPSSSDNIQIASDLILDGQLFIEAGDNFGPGKYPIMHFNGALTDNGLKVANAPDGLQFDVVVEPDVIIFGVAGKNQAAAVSQTVFLVVVPEPAALSIIGAAAMGLLMRRKRR